MHVCVSRADCGLCGVFPGARHPGHAHHAHQQTPRPGYVILYVIPDRSDL